MKVVAYQLVSGLLEINQPETFNSVNLIKGRTERAKIDVLQMRKLEHCSPPCLRNKVPFVSGLQMQRMVAIPIPHCFSCSNQNKFLENLDFSRRISRKEGQDTGYLQVTYIGYIGYKRLYSVAQQTNLNITSCYCWTIW